MRVKTGKVPALLLTLTLMLGVFCQPLFATEGPVLGVSYSKGKITVTGKAPEGVLAVAILLFRNDGQLAIETAGVQGADFSAEITMTLSPGSYEVKVADYDGGSFFSEASFTVPRPPAPDSETTEPVMPPSQPEGPLYYAQVTGGETLPVAVNLSGTEASVDLEFAGELSAGQPNRVTLPSIPDVTAYTISFPVADLGGLEDSITIETAFGSFAIPGEMLSNGELTGTAAITIGQGVKESLPAELKAAIGDRPLISLTLTIDGEQVDWNNPEAPVTVSIPYSPTEEELEHPESIILWYLDGNGRVITVPNGHYDKAQGVVIFTITHFSNFAVAFNKVAFDDVVPGAWYGPAVDFIAARGITSGTAAGQFSPAGKLTRGQFIVLMMKAYEIAADAEPRDNFADAGQTWYTGHLAAAKRLGISAGVGNNLFAPMQEITRQEMFTLLHNTLRLIDQLPRGESGKKLSDFADADSIAPWAKSAMAFLVEKGVIGGADGKLMPISSSTRAEMAQVLYNLLTR